MSLSRVICLLAMVTAQFAPAPPGASPPPLTPGTTWTYRYTLTRVSEAPVVGTLTIEYEGPATYRGRGYYSTVVSDTVDATLVERDYYVWTGGRLLQAAVETTVANTALEIVFDTPLPVDAEQRIAGKAQTFVNGTSQGEIPWSETVTSDGSETVTVPAGTYSAVRKWTRIFQFGSVRQVQFADSRGLVDLRVDSQVYVDGVLKSTANQELVSGPVQ